MTLNTTQSPVRIAAAIGCEVGDFFENSGDFVAFARRQGETFTFDSEKALIDYAEGLKEKE